MILYSISTSTEDISRFSTSGNVNLGYKYRSKEQIKLNDDGNATLRLVSDKQIEDVKNHEEISREDKKHFYKTIFSCKNV